MPNVLSDLAPPVFGLGFLALAFYAVIMIYYLWDPYGLREQRVAIATIVKFFDAKLDDDF
ncbi:hypothetical protein N7456_001132 [Penicillium angulare]|uniref:Uncharacterized protein n=1 Tax=Penicillium angulare TaxID=116970 RepID=A0A9W9GDF7_9EURO|nr:hypothetical protein N7456_001132 [Penicillium angulare]